jgi:hypothetical protein
VRRGWIDVAEEVVGRLFHDLVENSVLIARPFLEGTHALRFLERRYAVPAAFDGKLHQQPSDLASVVVICASLLHLDEAIDGSLILIDHTPLNVFAPERVSDLGTVGPIKGKNIGLNIGHGVWRCIDVRREWDASIVPFLKSAGEPEVGPLLGALSLRDRVPWFIASKVSWSAEDEPFTRVSLG